MQCNAMQRNPMQSSSPFPSISGDGGRSMAPLRPGPATPKSLFLFLSPSPSRTHLTLPRSSSSYHAALRCLADDFVYTPPSHGHGAASHRHFSALAHLLLRIRPLDTHLVAKGVSARAKDSMKTTISAMLGLLPSDQFRVSVRLFNRPLHQLLLSSLITGYTLWNAEYRMSLIRNHDLSPHNTQQNKASDDFQRFNGSQKNKSEGELRAQYPNNYVNMGAHQSLGELSSAAQKNIANMESEVQHLQKELDAQKCENLYLEHNREDSNDLLEYLRSLDPTMVYELSKPSSSEVEGIIYQLAQSIHHKFFNEAQSTDEADESGAHTSRDHLAKLLFWCMLMGHHLRGLEYRLHLSWLI